MSRGQGDRIAIDVEVSGIIEGDIETAAWSCAFVVVIEPDGVGIVEEEVTGRLTDEQDGHREASMSLLELHVEMIGRLGLQRRRQGCCRVRN